MFTASLVIVKLCGSVQASFRNEQTIIESTCVNTTKGSARNRDSYVHTYRVDTHQEIN